MKRYSWLKNFASFTADVDDTRIYLPYNLANLVISWQGDMTAGSAVTVEALDDLITAFELKVAGVPRVRLTGEELVALTEIVLGKRTVQMTAGATTDDKTRTLRCVLPVNMPAGGPEIYYNVDYTAVSGVDTTKLNLIAEYQDAALAKGPLKLLRYNFTPPSTGVSNTAIDTTPEGAVEGFLFYSTTVPTDSADTTSLNELEIEVGGKIETRTNVWALYNPMPYTCNVNGTATAYLWNKYLYLDLSDDPIPAGTGYKLYVKSDDTNAVRIIPIERL